MSERILYIFPHPDDESFGPAAAIHQQLADGHEVFLLTLTKGGATKQRHRLGLSVEEMGEVRYQEMLLVEQALKLSGMTVLDFPDSGLKELDPRILEQAIQEHIEQLKPSIVVSYPVHGISGFHDHLITHAVVKRLFLDMQDAGHTYLKRLAFYTVQDHGGPSMENGWFRLKHTPEELIDCNIALTSENRQAMLHALACYATYQDTIKASGVAEKVGHVVSYEFFGENFTPPLTDLTDNLPR